MGTTPSLAIVSLFLSCLFMSSLPSVGGISIASSSLLLTQELVPHLPSYPARHIRSTSAMDSFITFLTADITISVPSDEERNGSGANSYCVVA